MKRRRRIKDRNDQIVAEFRIQPHTCVYYSFQTDVALNHDQRARLCRRQSRGSQDNFIINAFAKLTLMPPAKWHAKSISKSNQGLANLSLEKHDDRHADVKQGAAQNKLQSSQALIDG